MKTNNITFFKFLPLFLAVLLIGSCDNDDVTPEFTIQPPSESVGFTFSPAEEYLVSDQTSGNVAERFVWSKVDFGVQTEISYQLQGSIDETFAAYDPTTEYDSGILSVTNALVEVRHLKNLADLLGLEPGDSGQAFFRVRAFAGSGEGEDAVDSVSDVIALNIAILEESSGSSAFEIASWGIVGSGYNDWGTGPDALFYTTNTPGVIVSYANLVDGEIKFRENNTWGGDLGDANLDGILDADADNNIAVTAGDYKVTINTNDNSYTIEEYSWGIVGSGYNDWGNAGPDAKFYYDYTTDTFKAGVLLVDGEIKFRMNNTWGTDLGDGTLDGTLDTESDNNIPVTAGYYTVTLDFNTNTYTIVEATLWGIVGSGYNDWGNGGPDFHLTETSPGMWIGSGATLIDGEIKFRPNDTWDGDYGDATLDGVLDRDADNNITVEAGNYVIMLDFSDEAAPTYTLVKR